MKYLIKHLFQKTYIPIRLIQEIRYELHLLVLRWNNRLNPVAIIKANNLHKLSDIKLHFGCGSRIIAGWINIDAYFVKDIHYCMDLRTSLPFSENSTCFIFSEHVLEHLEYDAIPFVFREFYRILKTDGVVRIIVPDLELFCVNYVDNNVNWLKEAFPNKFFSKTEAINNIFNGHFHRYMYDFDTLEKLLKEAKFRKIIKTQYLGSRYSELNIDTEAKSRQYQSICIEAFK